MWSLIDSYKTFLAEKVTFTQGDRYNLERSCKCNLYFTLLNINSPTSNTFKLIIKGLISQREVLLHLGAEKVFCSMPPPLPPPPSPPPPLPPYFNRSTRTSKVHLTQIKVGVVLMSLVAPRNQSRSAARRRR